MLALRTASETDRPLFDGFVEAHPSGDVLQTYAWGDLKARSGWTPLRLLVEDDGVVRGAVSLLERKLPGVGRSILYAPRGPVMDLDDAPLVAWLGSELVRIARRRGAILVKVDPPLERPCELGAANLAAAGFRPVDAGGFGGTQPLCVMQLDLGRDDEELLASFKPKWRYNIRLAERKGVEVRTDLGRADLPEFYRLLQETSRRDGFRVRSLAYFEAMWDELSPDGRIWLAQASFEGTAVSGALVLTLGDRAWYLYGASSNEHRNVMPNHLMQWRLIQRARDAGFRWYDFRGVSPRRGGGADEHLEGLNRFKEGFSPRFVEYIGELDLVVSPAWYWLWTIALPRVRALLKRAAREGEPAADG